MEGYHGRWPWEGSRRSLVQSTPSGRHSFPSVHTNANGPAIYSPKTRQNRPRWPTGRQRSWSSRSASLALHTYEAKRPSSEKATGSGCKSLPQGLPVSHFPETDRHNCRRQIFGDIQIPETKTDMRGLCRFIRNEIWVLYRVSQRKHLYFILLWQVEIYKLALVWRWFGDPE